MKRLFNPGSTDMSTSTSSLDAPPSITFGPTMLRWPFTETAASGSFSTFGTPSLTEPSSAPVRAPNAVFEFNPLSSSWASISSWAPRVVPLDESAASSSSTTASLPIEIPAIPFESPSQGTATFQDTQLPPPLFGSAVAPSSLSLPWPIPTSKASPFLTGAAKSTKLTSSSASPFPSVGAFAPSSSSSSSSSSIASTSPTDPTTLLRHKYKVHRTNASKQSDRESSSSSSQASTQFGIGIKAANQKLFLQYIQLDFPVEADFEQLDLQPGEALEYVPRIQKSLAASPRLQTLALHGDFGLEPFRAVLNDMLAPATSVSSLGLVEVSPACISILANAMMNDNAVHIRSLTLRSTSLLPPIHQNYILTITLPFPDIVCTPDDVSLLASATKYHSHLSRLFLTNVILPPASLEALCDAIKSPRCSVTTFYLHSTFLLDKRMNESLMCSSDAGIDDAGKVAILRLLRDNRSKIRHLKLNGNSIDDQGILEIVQAACTGNVVQTLAARTPQKLPSHFNRNFI
jgi:hypothetical protein